MSEKKLEPCPFCGDRLRLAYYARKNGTRFWRLFCDSESDCFFMDFDAEADAIEMGNRRSPPGWREGIEAAAKEIAERITALQQQIAEHNKWGHWLEAPAVERTILELKQRHFAIDSLTPPGDKEKE